MVLRFFSFFYSLITRSDLNFALKLLFYLDIVMNPLFHNDLSISDLLKTVRKSVLIYETIIVAGDPVVIHCLTFLDSFNDGVLARLQVAARISTLKN